jgi:hypothetical protein
MELLLNLVWLLVTLVCSIGLLRRARRNPDSPHLWVLVTAFVCIMVLLFPVISMTDDLHAELYTAEESGKRRVAAVQVQQLVAFVHVLAAWLLLALLALADLSWVTRSDESVPQPIDGTRSACFIRPPPLPVLA